MPEIQSTFKSWVCRMKEKEKNGEMAETPYDLMWSSLGVYWVYWAVILYQQSRKGHFEPSNDGWASHSV
ncbi:hypothetical protein VTO42DRAFT_2382 [Malbranchea cinnamomea]